MNWRLLLIHPLFPFTMLLFGFVIGYVLTTVIIEEPVPTITCDTTFTTCEVTPR